MTHTRVGAALTAAGILLGGCLGLPSSGFAQTPPAIELVAKGGLVRSTLVYSDDGEFFDPATGGAAGLSVSFRKLSLYGVRLQVEALFVQKGAKDAIPPHDQLAFDWLEIPILARADVAQAGGARIFVVAGPALDLQLRARFAGFDVADQYESWAMNVVAGGGVTFGRWLVEGRGSWGITNLPKGFSSDTLKDRSILVLGGLRLR